MTERQEAVIVSAVRTPVGKAKKGALKDVRPEDLAALVIEEALRRSGVDAGEVEDVILGCAMPEAEQGLNIGRIAAARAGLPDRVPGMTVNRFCSSGLQTIAIACEKIMAGFADCIVAGGVESMSTVPMTGNRIAPHPQLVDRRPEIYMAMGLTAEQVASRYGITREEQDEFALKSHEKAIRALEKGVFQEEIVPVPVHPPKTETVQNAETQSFVFEKDEGPRAETTREKLAELKPVFKKNGTVTAGNASQTSDGAACVVIMSRQKAQQLGLNPLARFHGLRWQALIRN